MYLILRNRVPERISHPLYTVEIVMLAALLFMYLTKNGAADEAAQEELEMCIRDRAASVSRPVSRM